MEPEIKLRGLLGESVPVGGTLDDTLFTEEEIFEFLEDAGGNVEVAAEIGWKAKAGKLAGLVDVTEGNSQRKMSQLLTNAQAMVKVYSRSSSGPTEGRARVGRIKRPS